MLGADPFFTPRRVQLALLAARHAIPAVLPGREGVEAGGLMSYGAVLRMRGARSAPTSAASSGARSRRNCRVQATKFELVIKTRKMLGLTLPPLLIARADEVIE